MDDEKIMDAEEQEGDQFERNIRPQSLKEYVGQEEITGNSKSWKNFSGFRECCTRRRIRSEGENIS